MAVSAPISVTRSLQAFVEAWRRAARSNLTFGDVSVKVIVSSLRFSQSSLRTSTKPAFLSYPHNEIDDREDWLSVLGTMY